MKRVYDEIVGAKDKSGRVRAEIFHKLPTAKELPEYYQVIARPMDLKTVLGRINAAPSSASAYSSLEEFGQDMLLMFDNAMEFNERGSEIFNDAKSLKALVEKSLRALGALPAAAAASHDATGTPSAGTSAAAKTETPRIILKMDTSADSPAPTTIHIATSGSSKKKSTSTGAGSGVSAGASTSDGNERKRMQQAMQEVYKAV